VSCEKFFVVRVSSVPQRLTFVLVFLKVIYAFFVAFGYRLLLQMYFCGFIYHENY